MQNEESPLHQAAEEVRAAERELVAALGAEVRAEADLERTIEKLAEVEARESQIIVNGRRRTVEGHRVSYEEAVKLAFPSGPTKQNTRFTVTYRNAAEAPASGELDPGQSVKVKPGRTPKSEAIFNVTETVLS